MAEYSHYPPPPQPPDLDLRLVRYFTVVADHLHFGRAAAALHLAQPSLSRQIRRLEEDLGARLLNRTPQGARLTVAGEAFLPDARALLRAAARAAARTRAAARPSHITIGHTADIVVTPAVRDLRHGFPAADVRTLHLDLPEPRAVLLDQRADVVVTRLPADAGEPDTELDVTVLYEEPTVLVVPVGHRLAGKESVTLDDIAGEPVPWRLSPDDPPGFPSAEDKLEVIASGQAVSLAPDSVRKGLRPDLRTVPVSDAQPYQVILAIRAGDHGPLLNAFQRAAALLVPRRR
ncbi:LysR family transcriptional regulator [Streptomyces sp. YIM S03343]